MAAQEYYSPSPQALPGPGILKPTAGYPTSTYQQPKYDIPVNQEQDYPSPATYNAQSYSPLQQNGEYNPPQPQPYSYQNPTQQPHHGDGHHQYPAVEPQSYRNLPSHLHPRRSISEPPDPRYLAQHIPGYNHRGRSRSSSSSSSSSSERSRSRSRSGYREHLLHSQARSTRSTSRSCHGNSHHHSHSRSRHARAARGRSLKNHSQNHNFNHKDRNTFLGAFGGGVIGDLLMPGLGTLGGALLGGFGGREVSRNRYKNEKSGKRDGRGMFGWSGKSYDEEWREGRIERGEISE